MPFVSLMVNTDATVRYCCMVKGNLNKIKHEDGTPYVCKDRLREAWNSEDMRDIRLNMIQGKKIEGCSVCYLQEETGRTSNREHANREWEWRLGRDKIAQLIDQALDNDGTLVDDLVYLDLRLGNLCNLKCRMCNPWNSSQIAREHLELDKTNKEYSEVWRKTFGVFPEKYLEVQEWFDSDILWDQVIALIPKLKKVYMTGGEPTLIKNNFKFMQSCIDQGRTDIVLFFNTNCTNINKKFLELISQFDQVNINASIDGVGVVNEYIRAPSDWTAIAQNVESLAQLDNVHLGITPTVQVYNIFNIVDTIKWVEELNVKYSRQIFIDFLINIHPDHLNINILPDDLRKQALSYILDYKDRMTSPVEMTINSLNGIIGLLQQPRSVDYQEQLDRLKTYTLALDGERSQDIHCLDTRLAALIA